MSTRANIILKDGTDKLFFYRHSDGYPEGVTPTLDILANWIKSGKVRNNIGQSAGWLIIIGALEYQSLPAGLFTAGGMSYMDDNRDRIIEKDLAMAPRDWKVGAYEPTTGIHGDIEYLYVFDIPTGTYEVTKRKDWGKWEASPEQADKLKAIAAKIEKLAKEATSL